VQEAGQELEMRPQFPHYRQDLAMARCGFARLPVSVEARNR